jgi:polyvinyl alcohol dehydrogenase (cytochrome)
MRRIAIVLFALASTRAATQPNGSRIYQTHCASCHDAAGATRIPSRATLQKMSSSAILKALTVGVMKQQGAGLSEDERAAVAGWLAKAEAAPASARELTNACPAGWKEPSTGASWTSWGADAGNWRFQNAAQAGLGAAQVPRLKLKWAFGVPKVTTMRSQPAVFRGRLFLGGDNGIVYALDAATGCVLWETHTKQPRSGMVIGRAGDVDAVFFGDTAGSVTALAVDSGRMLWSTRAGDHPAALITGTPAYAEGRLYVPVSSYEELSAVFPGYKCCTFRGSVVALDAANGNVLWRAPTIEKTAAPQPKDAAGVVMLGPSGAAIWSSPTVDAKLGRLYITTGDNYSQPPTDTSDALLAFDLQTGKRVWSRQFTKDDIYNISCDIPGKRNCPFTRGGDFDFGSSAILVSLAQGKRELLLGEKSGMIYAVDPDAQGRLLWKARAGEGGSLGGVQWGPATDGASVYVAVSDLRFDKSTRPGKLVLDPTQGGGIAAYRVTDGNEEWKTPSPGCGSRRPCSPAQSAAVTAIPGVVFSGSLDGHIRAYDAASGNIVWDFDTERDFTSVNGVPARGGSLDVGGPVIAGGMVYVSSGYPQYGGMNGNVLLAFGL